MFTARVLVAFTSLTMAAWLPGPALVQAHAIAQAAPAEPTAAQHAPDPAVAAEIRALVRRIAKTVVDYNAGYHAEACIDLARTFDDTSDFQTITGQSIEAGMVHTADQWVADPIKEQSTVAALVARGNIAGACYVRYSYALIYKSKNMDIEAERALRSARGFLVQLTAGTSVPSSAPAAASPSGIVTATPDGAVEALRVAAATTGVRVALLIANAQYRSGIPPLKNPRQDVDLIASALRKAGFVDVKVLTNVTRADMVAALRDFQGKADRADSALIYYAGHGIQSGGENYVLPVDAKLEDERSVADEAVSQDRMLQAMAKVGKLKILVLDACRDNPFVATMHTDGATRGVTRGLARVPPPRSHMLVVYSAAPGSQAQDGNGANSPFAAALNRRLLQPGVEIDLMLRQVTDDVEKATAGKQSPNTVGNIGADPFYFVPAKG